MKILLLEPYFTGSHATWAEGYRQHSRHRVEILSMSGHYWKWRMHGGAITLARKFLAGNYQPDLLLATDMLDLTTFLSLTRQRTGGLPAALYFHENQLTYPWSPTDRDVLQQRDNHYSFINYASALAAGRVFFNSAYHRETFLSELKKFLKHFPDNNELATIDTLRERSTVLPLGMDLNRFNRPRPENLEPPDRAVILWNHRWE